jgi:hypothetical protein
MFKVRRWYIYLVSAISLQAVTWAIISLLRNLFIIGIDPLAVAFQMAVVIVGLPVFLVHWLWGQRLIGKEVEERGATLRRLYLYGMMAAFLGPIVANVFNLIRRLLGGTSTYDEYLYRQLPLVDTIFYHLLALVVLAVLWFYHQRIVTEDSRVIPEMGGSATVRRLYVLGFSAAGLTMTTSAIINLIRWIMLQFGDSVIRRGDLGVVLADEIARLIIGVPLWIIFWRWAGRLFDGPSDEERASALRKFYLYGSVFIGALGAVANVTGILAGVFRRALSLPQEGTSQQPLPVIIGMGMLWAYHAIALREDTKQAAEAPRQAGVRRLYLYLITAIGLSALLIGLSGDINVIIRALGKDFGTSLREEFAWFTAAIIAGLPLWIIPWRQVQVAAEDSSLAGDDARRSLVRKIYLYFFLFVATMTVLSSAVYIIFRVLSMLLGEDPLMFAELGQAISFSLIAVGVWLYHGRALRGDRRISLSEQASSIAALRVTIVDVNEGSFGQAVIDELKREIPDIKPKLISLNPEVVEGVEAGSSQETITAQLAEAGLIVGPWMIAIPGGSKGVVSASIARAVTDSPARKLLVPLRIEGWEWAGVEPWGTEALIRHIVRAVKQIATGEVVKPARPMSLGTVIGIIIGVLLLLSLLAIPLSLYFA